MAEVKETVLGTVFNVISSITRIKVALATYVNHPSNQIRTYRGKVSRGLA